MATQLSSLGTAVRDEADAGGAVDDAEAAMELNEHGELLQAHFEKWCNVKDEKRLNLLSAIEMLGKQWIEWMGTSKRERVINARPGFPRQRFKVEPAGELGRKYAAISKTDQMKLFDCFAQHGAAACVLVRCDTSALRERETVACRGPQRPESSRAS